MKICVVQMKSVKGDVAGNIQKHIDLIENAIAQEAQVIIFPELSLTGYEPELAHKLAADQNDARFAPFQQLSDSHRITIGVGMPTKSGIGIHISMILFQPDQPRQMYSKKYLHVDEKPFFVSGANFPVLAVEGIKIGLAICYELSIEAHAEAACAQGAEAYVASVAKHAVGVEDAIVRLAGIATQYGIPVLLSNCVGASDNFVGGGRTAVWSSQSKLLSQLDEASEGFVIYDSEMGTAVLSSI